MLTNINNWPIIIQIHAGAAVLALAIGPFAIWRARKDTLHRICGAIWIALMLIVASSAWFVHSIRIMGRFSPIHLFSLWTYWSLFVAYRHVKNGRYRQHGEEMRALYLYALGLTGVLTLLPGRRMHALLFGDSIVPGVLVMAVLSVSLIVVLRRKPRLRIIR